MTTGDRMKSRRKELGIPVENIAAALHVSVATVYRYENGDIEKVPGAVLEPLAAILRTTPAWLMGWDTDRGAAQIIAANISNLLALNRMTKKELADRLRVSDTSVSNWCSGQKVPRMDKIDAMARIFGVSRDYFYTDQSATKWPAAEIQPFNPTHRIPILGRISAGLPIYAEEHIEGYTYTELNGGAEYFALRVVGDSMTAARIHEGDLLIVRRQEIVENGEIAVVIVEDTDATVKRFYQDGNIVTLMPQSTNPVHKPQIYDLTETRLRVLGRVVKNQISY